MRRCLKGLLGALVLTAAFVSCDAADEAFDCQAVCQKYHDCYSQDYDVGKCRDTCRAKAAHDDSVKQAADTCEACIDGKSCAGATFECGGSCTAIVP